MSEVRTLRSIPLSPEYETTVDAFLYDWLTQWTWKPLVILKCGKVYAFRVEKVNGKDRLIYMHREIVGVRLGSKRIVDHKDGNSLLNTGGNLRIASSSQNNANSKRKKKFGLKGAYPTAEGRFMSKITVNRVPIHLGVRDTEEEAHGLYCAAAVKYFGDFARFE